VRVALASLPRHPVLFAGTAQAQVLARLERFFEVEVAAGADLLDRAVLRARVAGKSALMATQTAGIDASLLAALPHLRAVCKTGPSHADIDLAACTRAGVMATNTPDLGDDAEARSRMMLVAAENLIAVFGFGRAAGHPQNLLNTDLRCMLGCCC
jgi:lactate dehydrogenase-like 2-hydroxyacid dehydrogenase